MIEKGNEKETNKTSQKGQQKDHQKNTQKTQQKRDQRSPQKEAQKETQKEPQQLLTKFSQYQRVGVFVDVQNMFYSAKHIRGAKLDFSKLMDKAVRGRQLIRAACYVIDNPDVDQTNFIDMLKTNGYEIRSKLLRTRADGSAKGDWDMGLAIDAISMAEKLDIVVLVSGDGDFADLVYHLKSRGVLVEAISFRHSTNEDLIKAVDVYIPIEKEMLYKTHRR